jgi:hypothetical protein
MPPIVEYVGPAGRQLDKPFSRLFFHINSLVGRPEKVLFNVGVRQRKNARKISCPSAETIYLRPGQGVGLILFRGGEELRYHRGHSF